MQDAEIIPRLGAPDGAVQFFLLRQPVGIADQRQQQEIFLLIQQQIGFPAVGNQLVFGGISPRTATKFNPIGGIFRRWR